MNNKRSRSTVRSTKEKAFNNKMKPQKDKNTEDKNTSLIIDTMDNAEKTDYVELKYDITHLSELHNDKHISVIFDKLFKKLAKKYQDITTLGNELTTLKEQYEDLEKNNKDLENSKKQTENINKQITNDHEEEIQTLENKVKDKEDENEKLKDCINNLKEKETNMKVNIEQLTENENRNKVMRKNFEDQKHIYEDTIKQKHSEIQRIETDNIGLRVKIQETEDRIKDLLKEYSNQVSNLESKVKVKQDEISNLKNDINDSMKIREEMEKAVDIFKTEINKNAILIQHKDKQSSRWKRMVDEKDTELVNKSNDIEKLEVAIKIMKMKMTVMEEVISKNNTESNDKRNTVRCNRDQSETIAEESEDDSFNMGPQFSDSLYILSYNEQSIANEIDESLSMEANHNAKNGQNYLHHHPQKEQYGRNTENYITCTNIDNHIPCDDADKNNPGGGTSKEDNKLKRKEDNDPNNPSGDVHSNRFGDDNGNLNGGDDSESHDIDNDSDNTKGAGSGGGTEDGGPDADGSDGDVDDGNHNDGVGDSNLNHNGGDPSGDADGDRHNGGTNSEKTYSGGFNGGVETYNLTHTTPEVVLIHQKYISSNNKTPTREKPEYDKTREFSILEKLANIENKMKEYEQRIDHLEEPKSIQPKKTEHTKITFYILGDSHIRYIDEILGEDNELKRKHEIKTNFKPGIGVKQIKQLLPEYINGNTNAVISIGTNDLYKTDTDTFIKEIENICKYFNRTILISTPPQTNQKTNQDIISFNTRIKHHFKKNKMVEILNTHNFIKNQHLARDGVHLGWKAKRWLASKISHLIQNKETPIQEKQLKISKNNEPLNKSNDKPWDEQFQKWQTQQNERWQQITQLVSGNKSKKQQNQNDYEEMNKNWPTLRPKKKYIENKYEHNGKKGTNVHFFD
uniref:Uncharacterized protein n=1 Tax=Cacopsylla melanoneura TaxID=428564 RepID=A0A8D8QLU2_9HEMI